MNEFPIDNSIDVSLTPLLSWEKINGAVSYLLVVAEDLGLDDKFAVFDFSATVKLPQFKVPVVLKANTKYWWKVKPQFKEGGGDWSIYSFTTGESK